VAKKSKSSLKAAGRRARPRLGRRTKDMPDGRQALLRAATRAFGDNGFDAADIRSIAAAAGVSPNLVRVHFGSKADLWDVCLDAIVAGVTPTMREISVIAHNTEWSVYERLRRTILRVIAYYETHPEVHGFIARYGLEAPERARLVTERLLLPAYETNRELFGAGMEAGILRCRHPALFFALLNTAVNQAPTFLMLVDRLAPDIAPVDARRLMTETIIATLLHTPAEPATVHQPVDLGGSPTSGSSSAR
jgi:AcrR family transcriptional regulator